ncbi:MAG: Spy/CpxP family protein refolding chaperone, partial [Dissulfurimicrobium sp.]
IRAIKKEGFEAFRNARKNLKNPMLEATKSPIFDKAVFISTAVDNTKTLAQIRAENFEKFYSILTPEQRQKFVAILKSRMTRHFKRPISAHRPI